MLSITDYHEPVHADGAPAVSGSGPGEGAGERRARLLAERTGEREERVERQVFDLSLLLDEGAVVDVDARGSGMFLVTLDLTDLGVTLPEGARSRIRPIRCLVIPDDHHKALTGPGSRAHDALAKLSYSFDVISVLTNNPGNRWVPLRAYPEWKAQISALQAELASARERYADEYPVIVERMAEVFGELAANSRRLLTASGADVPPDFEEAFVGRMVSRIPTPEEVERKLTLSYVLRSLDLGSEMLAEQRATAEERGRLRLVEQEQRIERERLQAEEHALQQELWASEERLRRQLDEEERERRRDEALREEMCRDKLEAHREMLRSVRDPYQEGIEQLHATVHECVVALQQALREGHLEARKAREMSRLYRLMNFTSEPELDALVEELERLVRQAQRDGKRKRDEGALGRNFAEIIELTYKGARAVTERSRADAIRL
jgi:hypothetical protein